MALVTAERARYIYSLLSHSTVYTDYTSICIVRERLSTTRKHTVVWQRALAYHTAPHTPDAIEAHTTVDQCALG